MRLLMIVILATLTACAEPAPPITAVPITYGTQSGDSADDAVIIIGAKDKDTFDQAKRDWLSTHYPGWTMGESKMSVLAGLGDDAATYYQEVQISNGTMHKLVYFDISVFVYAGEPNP